MKNTILCLIVIFCGSFDILAQDSPKTLNSNWVSTKTYRLPASAGYVEDVMYYDGLGYPAQKVEVHASPLGNTIIYPIYYDEMRRDSTRAYLPYATETASACMVSDPFADAFYENTYGWDESGYVYRETNYDNCITNRKTRIIQPGENLREKASLDGLLYATDISYGLNRSDSVMSFRAESDSLLLVKGYWKDGILKKTTSVNEDGCKAVVFTDGHDRTLLSRTFLENQRLDTYYVYDELGRLCWVIPPEGASVIEPNQSTYTPQTVDPIRKYCYFYRYDKKNRLVEKQLPGCAPEVFAYDNGGRLIEWQDGNLRVDSLKVVHMYDNLGREYETYLSSASLSKKYLSKMFFDDPSKVDLPLWDEGLNFVPIPDVVSNSDLNLNTKGYKVYEILRVLHSDMTAWNLSRAFYYDHKGRLIQTTERNVLGGVSRMSTQYDFCGNIIISHESHQCGNGQTPDNLVRQYTYDERGRMIAETVSVNCDIPVSVCYSYDEVGRKSVVSTGSESHPLDMKYSYLIQGWLNRINSPHFNITLNYDMPFIKKTRRLFSGNISEMMWTHFNGVSHTYAFEYDDLYRLIDTKQYINGVENNQFVEKNLSYDKNGNILTLQRTEAGALVNNLTYSYNGNQLQALVDKEQNYSYDYDSNGNMRHDGMNNQEVYYNCLNLVDRIEKSGNLLTKYLYLWDGTKLSAQDAEGNGMYYLGSLVYEKRGEMLSWESAAFGGGQLVAKTGSESASQDPSMPVTYAPYYFLTDHLGSVRAVVDWFGNPTEQNNYYPYGTRWNSTDLSISSNRYRYNGKEDQGFVNVPYTDYGARMYDTKVGRWPAKDPKAENYYTISPYAFCAGSPINYVDPDGRDIWEINQWGEIITRKRDYSMDGVFMVDSEGNRIEDASKEFKFGTIESQKSYSMENGSFDVFRVRGDENGTALFNFMADNITGSFTEVEIGRIMTGIEGDKGLNFITTSHTPKTEKSILNLMNGQLIFGYTVREINHSHPKNAYPSGLVSRAYDIGVAGNITDFYKYKGMNSPLYHIYHVPTKSKIPYSQNSTLGDFNLRIK